LAVDPRFRDPEGAWKGRCAYRFSREVTVYVRHGDAGRGLGSALYASMIPQLQQLGLHALLGGIALPNEASVALHEKFGFTKTAHLREVGWKFNHWIDVGYWQRLL
jgi:phosphinothricin acetyltransferase